MVSLVSLLYLAVLRSLFIASNGLILRELTLKYRISLTRREWIGLPFATSLGNLLIPFSGGLVARAAYLKHRHSLPYAQFTSLLAATYLVYFCVIGAAGFVVVATSMAGTTCYIPLLLFVGIVVVANTIAGMLPSVRLPWQNRLAGTLNNALEGWTVIKKDRALLVRLAFYSLLNLFLNGLSFWVVYRAFDPYSSSFASMFLVSLLSTFSILVNLTPGNLGIAEAFTAVSSGILGLGTGMGILVALTIRISTLVPSLLLGALFSFILGKGMTGTSGKHP